MKTAPASGLPEQPRTPPRVTSASASEQTPTSTFGSLASPSTTPNRTEARGHSFFASTASSSTSLTLARTLEQPQLSVRSDPALLTCFDPADKELYDLWVPKR